MITATSKDTGHVTEITDGRGHYFFADTPVEDENGSDLYARPGELLTGAYAACMNITARKLLAREGLTCEEAITSVDMDRSNPDKIIFHFQTELKGNLPDDVKQKVLKEIENCPVCQILRTEKQFLPL